MDSFSQFRTLEDLVNCLSKERKLVRDVFGDRKTHVYTMDLDGNYVTKRSWESDNTLSPGEAFFTQTATINKEEHLHFAQLLYTSSASTNTGNTRNVLNISLSSADATGEDAYRSVGVSHAAGVVSLQPVDNTSDEYASLVYSINRDGAKFMSMNPAIPDECRMLRMRRTTYLSGFHHSCSLL